MSDPLQNASCWLGSSGPVSPSAPRYAARAGVNENGWDDDPVADDEWGGIAVGVRELVERFYERLWNAWDDDAVEGILAEDFKFRGLLGQQTVGREGWRAYRDQVRTAAPDFSNELVDSSSTVTAPPHGCAISVPPRTPAGAGRNRSGFRL